MDRELLAVDQRAMIYAALGESFPRAVWVRGEVQALHVSRGVSFWDAMILGVVLGGWRGDPLFVRI